MQWKGLTDWEGRLHLGHLMSLLSQMPILPDFHSYVSYGVNHQCFNTVYHTLLENQLQLVMTYHLTDKQYRHLCSRGRAGGSSLIRHPKQNHFVNQSPCNRPTHHDFGIWNSLLSRDTTRPPNSCRLSSKHGWVGCKGDTSVALTPVQDFRLRHLYSTREIWSEITGYPKPSEPPTDSFYRGREIKVK